VRETGTELAAGTQAAPAEKATAPRVVASGLFVVAVAAAISFSAVLLFWVELLFPSMLLLVMGGTPATWVTALMFYQAILLLGYFYSFALMRWMAPRTRAAIHLLVLAAAVLVLPPAVPATPATLEAFPAMRVLYLMTLGIGLPLFALAATAPLVQQHFAGTAHPSARDPYFLYAASNAGSLAALVAYPVAIEAVLGHAAQTHWWTIGFLVAATGVLACLLMPVHADAWNPVATARPPHRAAFDRTVAPRALWLVLAAVPSSLLSGTTLRITTDIAAGPLFWMIPLTLYLLTFIMAFARRRPLALRVALLAQPVALVPVVIGAFGGRALIGEWPLVAAMLILFFLSAYICHVRLADGRPGPERTTEFYLIIAIGGFAGGAFNALIAPHIFPDIVEYPLALVLAVALRPADAAHGRGTPARDGLGAAVVVLAAALVVWLSPPGQFRLIAGLLGLVFSVALVALAAVPSRFAIALAAAFAASQVPDLIDPPIYQTRNFFGVLKVVHDRANNTYVLLNGSTAHGEQSRDPMRLRELAGYYHAGGPYAEAVAALSRAHGIASAAVIGLGAGTVACSGAADTRWTFYEINPADVMLATDPRYFSFLADCQPRARILVGDGRLLLEAERQRFDLILLDAFSSDAIPSHLLTVEAFSMYLDKLSPDGMILANTSNRFVDINPVLAAAAARVGLSAAWRFDGTSAGLARPSKWVAMARSPATIAPLQANSGWTALEPTSQAPWTDDRTDLFELLLAGLRDRK